MKRVVAVITFNDDKNEIRDTSEAATWIACELYGNAVVDVTVYSTAEQAAADEREHAGDFRVSAQLVPTEGVKA